MRTFTLVAVLAVSCGQPMTVDIEDMARTSRDMKRPTDLMVAGDMRGLTSSVMTWNVTNGCMVGGLEIDYKLYDERLGLIWPGPNNHHVALAGRVDSFFITCITGDNVCFGGMQGTAIYGVGKDNTQSCKDCCHHCIEGVASIGFACP